MMRKIGTGLFLCGLGVVGPFGCMGSHTDQLDSRLFIAPSLPGTTESLPSPPPRTVAAAIDPSRRTVVGEIPKSATVLPVAPAPTPRPFDAIEPLGELTSAATTQPSPTQSTDAVAPAPAASALPATAVQTPLPAPLTAPGADVQDQAGRGVYMTLGGVIAVVNGTPIYTSEVLAPLKKRFSVKSRELESAEFERYAFREIMLQLQERIESELRFSNAYHSLTEEDRNLTEAEAMMIRHERVTAAGGSVQEARRLSTEAGEDFDESIRQEYRLLVIQTNAHRELTPMIQISADNMRDFYNQNVAKLYSTKAQAQFRVIEIDPDKCSNMSAAKEKACDIRDKAVKGADFSALAGTENDDDFLKTRHGNPLDAGQWMEKNTFMVDAVDSAVWELQPGQVTPVIEAKGKIYVAKMEARRGGTIQPFEDQAVQADLYGKIWQLQYNRLYDQHKEVTSAQDVVVHDLKRVRVALEIAMQGYAQAQAAAAQSAVGSTGH